MNFHEIARGGSGGGGGRGCRRSRRRESESVHTRRGKSKSRISRKVGRIKGQRGGGERVFLNRGSLASRVANQNMGRSFVEDAVRERSEWWVGWKCGGRQGTDG